MRRRWPWPAPRPRPAVPGAAPLPDAAEDCAHTKRAVQIWVLGADAWVEVAGPGADDPMRYLTPRDLAGLPDGRRAYALVCGPGGGMLGDPMAMPPEPGRWWLSRAADLAPWIAALAGALRREVRPSLPDLHALGVQGPLALLLLARVMGEGMHEISPHGWRRLPLGPAEILVARSDLSRQGGFEILIEGRAGGVPLWRALGGPGRISTCAPPRRAPSRIKGRLLALEPRHRAGDDAVRGGARAALRRASRSCGARRPSPASQPAAPGDRRPRPAEARPTLAPPRGRRRGGARHQRGLGAGARRACGARARGG